ncbi:hypothetical protein WA171_006345 [Blastocystis sp. BT1]
MICIPLVLNESGQETWVLIELQGKLHNIDGDGFCGIDLGTLGWVDGNPVLTIGNHLCEGKVIKLRKPLAIMRRIKKTESSEAGVEYVVEAMIKEKYLFSARPRPLLR